ncbi:3-oxoacyl-[acyl-carrier protein] reductase [Spirosomataceae bacterium TFI 002]|nr:3-oxoacyl-[acyl-carrier protein] reductase [Spirosomataceae bacterium TFI 002]
MNLDLSQKNALVCGGTDGIGWATAVELANLGANICLFARNEEKLKDRLSQLHKTDRQKHHYLVADFSSLSNVQKALENSDNKFHILVNNTGGPTGGKIIEEAPEKFAATFEQHLMINQFLSQKVVPFMKSEGFGRIVNIISVSVKQPILGLGVSNTVRWAVASWAKTLSKELSHTGITVNNVLPGFTKTGRLDQVNKMRAENESKSIAEVEKVIEANIPSGRFAMPEEVAAAVAFLCSPIAQSINGINLPVDGGFSATL